MFDPLSIYVMCYCVQTDMGVWLPQLGNMEVVASRESINTPTPRPLHIQKSSRQHPKNSCFPTSSKEGPPFSIPRQGSSYGIHYQDWVFLSEILTFVKANREKRDAHRLEGHSISIMPPPSRQGSSTIIGQKFNVC